MKTLIARHKAGEHIGICSVCSAHPLVIEAALAFDRNSTRKVLIEATSNQVNQFWRLYRNDTGGLSRICFYDCR